MSGRWGWAAGRAACAACGAVLGSARADEGTITPVRANTLYQSPLPASNGAGWYCYAGVSTSAFHRRALLAFDVGAAVPAGATITGATLTLTMSRCGTDCFSTIVLDLHRVTADWGEAGSDAGDPGGQGAEPQEGDATWEHRFWPDVLWVKPGGDHAEYPSASAAVGGLGEYAWGGTAEMAADVQSWLDAPESNHGWILRAPIGAPLHARRFNTREHPDPSTRPRLTITFIPPFSCCVDYNGDEELDFSDIEGFLVSYNAQTPGSCAPGADLNGDEEFDFSDIERFLALYTAGC